MKKLIAVSIAILALSTLVLGDGLEEKQKFRTTLRPDLVDTGYKCSQMAKEGTYYVSLKDRIELDLRTFSGEGCGVDKISAALEGKGVIKQIFPHYYVILTGSNETNMGAMYFEVKQHGEETVTITLDDQRTFQYHFIVWP